MTTTTEMEGIVAVEKSLHEICDLRPRIGRDTTILGLVLIRASWNDRRLPSSDRVGAFLARLTRSVLMVVDCGDGDDDAIFCADVRVDDSDEESLVLCIGEKGSTTAAHPRLPLPPGELPALAVVLQQPSMEHSIFRYVSVSASHLVEAIHAASVEQRQHQKTSTSTSSSSFAKVLRPARSALEALVREFRLAPPVDQRNTNSTRTSAADAEAIRIFVAGDRSSVGKSSVCLGILGNLLAAGYPPESLAYVKPATQSESTQLIQLYCEQQGIDACVPIGPLVYYRGFTRAFLAGETESTAQLLAGCGRAVDRVAREKQVVLIDGVGFPAVGSICGTSNAAVARACGYPLLLRDESTVDEDGTSSSSASRKPMGVCLVGGSGVGAAVDAFNLNATYFEQAGVPVLGAIFNKLSETGFYSLENCRTQVSSYFDQNAEQIAKGRRPFGFVPLFPRIAGKNAMQYVEEYLKVFGAHVDVNAIVEAAKQVKAAGPVVLRTAAETARVPKRQKLLDNSGGGASSRPMRSREEIESSAIGMGAAPSA